MNASIQKWYEHHSSEVTALSDKLYQNCEVALETYDACTNTAAFMRNCGFSVEEIKIGKVEKFNCVVAAYGCGKPVIGILGEFDGLPGLGNRPVPYYDPVPGDAPGPGHGCGHHLMGAGCAGAAAAVKAAMEEEHIHGTVIYFGCPAEETLEGKVYMAKEGLFSNLDFCIAWHPTGWVAPAPSELSNQATVNIFYNFYGKTAHAAADPENGRSALDAAELMTTGVNYLREHVPSDVRMHYCYINAGEKPNIVPDFARVQFFVRARTMDTLKEVLERVTACAEGAAIMTGTTTKNELAAGCYDTLLNHTGNRFMYEIIKGMPPIEYDDTDREFARTIYQNATGKEPTQELLLTVPAELTGTVTYQPGSTDVGDVSQIVPTVQMYGGGGVNGLPAHHWTVTATMGTQIGHKAEIYAGKVLAETAYEAFKNPDAIEKMWEEFREARKGKQPYKAMLPE